VVAIKLLVFTGFGLLQPLVALRLDPGHVGCAARRHRCVARGEPDRLLLPARGHARLPRGIAVIDWLLLLALVAGSASWRGRSFERPGAASLVARGKEVIVVGAGDAAQLVIREMQKSRALGYTPIGVVDDDPRKKNLRLHGVRVLGTTDELPHILRDNKPDELLIAIPSASGEVRRRWSSTHATLAFP
jgi:FlaA1/EpsC-like NDP-sugar epimerase